MRASELQCKYSCGECGRMESFQRLAYCVQCQALKCPLCCSQEVSSTYCPSTLANFSSSETSSLEGRSDKAFQCAQCSTVCTLRREEGQVFLRCPHCEWSSREWACASDAESLLRELNEQHRPGSLELEAAAARFREAVKEDKEQQAKRRQSARYKRTAHLLSMTPAKAKFFPLSLTVSPKTLSFGEEGGEDQEQEPEVQVPRGAYTLEHLERKLASERAEARHEEPAADTRRLVERAPLLSRTSRHCEKCDKLLVKADASASNAMDFKRLHLSYTFVPELELVALQGGVAHFAVYNPLSVPIEVHVEPQGADAEARWLLEAPVDAHLKPLGIYVPTPLELKLKQGSPSGEALLLLRVGFKFESSFTNQEAAFTVSWTA